MNEVHLELRVPQHVERMLIALRIEQIAHQKNEPAPSRLLRERAARLEQSRGPGQLRRSAEKLEHLVKLALATRQAEVVGQLLAKPIDVDAVEVDQPDVGERRRHAARLVQLRSDDFGG